MEDLDAEAPKSCDATRVSLGIRLADKKRGLADGSNIEHDLEVNFKHQGHKTYKVVIPKDIRLSLREDFLGDVESFSTEPANLYEVIFVFFIIS